jgi:hypothetical protein
MNSIADRHHRKGTVPKEQITERVCLCCEMKFGSVGPHNRICPRCSVNAENAREYRGGAKDV